MDARVWNQICLEFGHIYVEGAIEPQRGSEGRDNLRNYLIQIYVGRILQFKMATADFVEGFVVDHVDAVAGVQSAMGGEDCVVWFYHSCG